MIAYVLLTRFEVHDNSLSNSEADATIELATPARGITDRCSDWQLLYKFCEDKPARRPLYDRAIATPSRMASGNLSCTKFTAASATGGGAEQPCRPQAGCLPTLARIRDPPAYGLSGSVNPVSLRRRRG